MSRKKKLIIIDESEEEDEEKQDERKDDKRNQKILTTFLLFAVLSVSVLSVKAFGRNDKISASRVKNIFDSSFESKRNLIERIPIESGPIKEGEESEEVFYKECPIEGVRSKDEKQIIINEVAWMGDQVNANHEWVELKNKSDTKADISYWQLIDKGEDIKIFFPKNTIIERGEFLLLERTSDASVSSVKADFVYSGSLTNANESLMLINEVCEIVDEVSTNPNWGKGDNKTKKTMERNEDTENWHTSKNIGGTPKKENTTVSVVSRTITERSTEPIADIREINEATRTAPNITNPTTIPTTQNEENKNTPLVAPQNPQSPEEPLKQEATPTENNLTTQKVIISELMVGKEGNNEYEFIELYNPTENLINISLWSIKRKTSSGKEYSLLSANRMEGKSIGSGKYFLVVNEEGYNGRVAPDATWAKSNTLAYTSNSVALLNEKGEVIDEVIWTEIEKDQSLERNVERNILTPQLSPNPQNSSN